MPKHGLQFQRFVSFFAVQDGHPLEHPGIASCPISCHSTRTHHSERGLMPVCAGCHGNGNIGYPPCQGVPASNRVDLVRLATFVGKHMCRVFYKLGSSDL